jgi:hypothetical protein
MTSSDLNFNKLHDFEHHQCRGCHDVFQSSRALMAHIHHHPTCARTYTPYLHPQPVIPTAPPLPSNPDDLEPDFPLDDEHPESSEDSVATDGLDDSVISDGLADPIHLPFTLDDQVEVALLEILKSIGAPLGAYKRLMEWACAAHRRGYTFLPSRTTYHAQVQHFQKRYNMTPLRPERTNVFLEGHSLPTSTVWFDFLSNLKSILEDPFINCDANLLVNPDDHFKPYISPDGLLGEVLTGSWYRRTCERLIKDPEKDFVLPIATAADEVFITEKGQYKSHPFVMFPLIFKRHIRHHPRSTRVLGYISHPFRKSNRSRPSGRSRGQECRNLHVQLKIILKTFSEAQVSKQLRNFKLRLGSQTKVVNLIIPTPFIICDVQGADYFVCRPPHYGKHAIRINRACTAKPETCGNPRVPCEFITEQAMKDIYRLRDPQQIKQAYMYDCYNAFWDLNWGNDIYGVYSGCLSETLHQLENGTLKHALDFKFSKEFGTRLCSKIDEIARWFTTFPRHHGEDEFGRIRFPRGITKLTFTTASEKTMIAIVFIMTTVTHKGQYYLKRRYKVQGWRDMIEGFELILCFLVWSKQDTFWPQGCPAGRDRAHRALRKMMLGLKRLLPRRVGESWNITKVHELMHIAFNIMRFGAPANTHSGQFEANHKQMAVNPAKTARKERSEFDWQVANRQVDHLVIEKVYQTIHAWEADPGGNGGKLHDPTYDTDEPMPDAPIQESTNNSSHCYVHVECLLNNLDQHEVYFEENWTGTTKSVVQYPPGILSFVIKSLGLNTQPNNTTIHFLTEYHRDNVDYRAHPNYRSNGPWQDWITVRWEGDIYTPSQLQCFFRDPQDDSRLKAVVKCCKENPKRHSVLTDMWTLETLSDDTPVLQIIDVDTLQHHVCMFPFAPASRFVFQLRSKTLWPEEFVSEENAFEEHLGDVSNDDLTSSSDSDESSVDEHGIDTTSDEADNA